MLHKCWKLSQLMIWVWLLEKYGINRKSILFIKFTPWQITFLAFFCCSCWDLFWLESKELLIFEMGFYFVLEGGSDNIRILWYFPESVKYDHRWKIDKDNARSPHVSLNDCILLIFVNCFMCVGELFLISSIKVNDNLQNFKEFFTF
jgi:hypothetical protein